MDYKKGKELCFQVLDLAEKAGVRACDVILQRGNSLSLQSVKGRIDKSKVTSTQVIGIRVIHDQKVGIAASESLDLPMLKMMVEQAKATSKYASVDPYQTIEQKNAADMIQVPDEKQRTEDRPIQEKVDLAIRLEQDTLKSDSRIHNAPYSGYSDGEGEAFYANHLGSFCYQKDRSYSIYTSALAGTDGAQAMHFGSSVGRNFEDLDLSYCVGKASKTALSLLTGKALPTGRYDVIFTIDELENILGAHLSAFSGKAAMDGIGYYRDKIGEIVADSNLTIRDRPTMPEGYSFSVFDDEGLPRRDLTLVDKGRLQSFFHNSATARYFKLPSTAHASRGAKSSLGTSSTQLVIDTGKASKQDLYAGKVLKIISLKGLHSGTNSVSGHFSLAAEGVLFENNVEQQIVKDITLSGNFYEIIRNVQALGAEPKVSSSQSFFSPEIRFAGLSVAGS